MAKLPKAIKEYESYPEQYKVSCAVARGECQWGPQECVKLAEAAEIGLTHNEHTGHGVHIDSVQTWYIRGQGN